MGAWKRKTIKIDLVPDFGNLLSELVHVVAPVAKQLGLRVFLVGGTVRDMLAHGVFSGDCDLVVFGPDGGARKLAETVASAWRWREPVSFPRFGTHLVMNENYKVEFSQARLRTKLQDLDPDPVASDALSRDFTLNALYIDLATVGSVEKGFPGTVDILDPTGDGITDLDAGVLKTPLPGKTTLSDDPLRIFRAARFKAVNGYRLHPAIGKAVESVIHLLPNLAPERIRVELDLILLSEKPSPGLEVLGRWRAFSSIAPEIQAMVGFKQNTPWHFPDLFKHTLRVIDRCPPDLNLRWAALLHDCGKPLARVASANGDTYYGHEYIGAEGVRTVLKRLKCSRQRTREVEELVRLHMVHYQGEWSERAVGRFIRRAGSHLDKLLDLVEADSASLRLRRGKVQEIKKLRERVASTRDKLPSPRSPLDGQEIMDLLKIESGELVGRAKAAVAEAVGEGLVPPDEEAARVFLLDWYAQLQERSWQ